MKRLSWRVTLILLGASVVVTAAGAYLVAQQNPRRINLMQVAVDASCGRQNAQSTCGSWERRAYWLVWSISPSAQRQEGTPRSADGEELQRWIEGRDSESLPTRLRISTALRSSLLVVCLLCALSAAPRRAGDSDAVPPQRLSYREIQERIGVFARSLFVVQAVAAAGAVAVLGVSVAFGIGAAPYVRPWIGPAASGTALATLWVLAGRHVRDRPLCLLGGWSVDDGVAALKLVGLALLGDLALEHFSPLGGQSIEAGTSPNSVLDWVAEGIDLVVIAPVLEELLFRWLLYSVMRTRLRPLASAIASSLAFAALHVGQISEVASAGWFGFVMAIGYARFASIRPLVAAHALYNLQALLISLALRS